MIIGAEEEEKRGGKYEISKRALISLSPRRRKETRKWALLRPWDVFMVRFKEGSKPLRVFQRSPPPPPPTVPGSRRLDI